LSRSRHTVVSACLFFCYVCILAKLTVRIQENCLKERIGLTDCYICYIYIGLPRDTSWRFPTIHRSRQTKVLTASTDTCIANSDQTALV